MAAAHTHQFEFDFEAAAQDDFIEQVNAVNVAQALTMAAEGLPLSWIQSQKLHLLAAEAQRTNGTLLAPPF